MTQIGLGIGGSSFVRGRRRLLVGTTLPGTDDVLPFGFALFQHTQRTAFWTGRFGWRIPTGKLAFRVLITAKKFPSFLRTPLDNLSSFTFRTSHAGLFLDRLDVLTFRIT